ncbi:MAG: outer membrane protein assembly factor BamD [Ignavibacteriaceae bacterium]|nr:outer membrane protein assembly factor BamD [Ignavibacteriaceae bacterium]
MRQLLLIFLFGVLFFSCSSSIDTVNMSSQERLDYAISLYNDEDYELSVTEFQAIILQYPGNAVIDDAQYYLAMSRFKRGELILAAFEFSKLIKNMPVSEFVPQAQFMLAESYYELSPDYSLDQRYTKKAIEEYQAFLDFFPANPSVPEAEKKIHELNEKLAQKEFNNALIYEKLEFYIAALKYYDTVLEVYHDTKFAPMASYNKINLLIARNRSRDALDEITKFLQRYPSDQRVKEIEGLKNSLENLLSASK